MTNPVTTLRPSGYSLGDIVGTYGTGADDWRMGENGGLFPFNPYGSILLNDNDDSTWIVGLQPDNTLRMACYMQTLTLPAGALVTRVRQRARIATQQVASAYTTVDLALYLSQGGADNAGNNFTGNSSSFNEIDGSWTTTAPDGGAWTVDKVNSLRYQMLLNYAGSANNAYVSISEIYLDVEYNLPSSVAITSPANGTVITDNNKPQIQWTYSDPEGDAQSSYQVVILSSPQDPGTAIPGSTLYNSGTQSGAATSHSVSTALPDGQCWVYLRTTDAGTTGWSPWSVVSITINTAPGVVTVTSPGFGQVVTQTDQPTIQWAFNDAGGPAQDRFQVLIFESAQSDPQGNSAGAVASSGEILSAAGSWTPSIILDNATYWVYVKAGNTVNGTVRYSAWASTSFYLNVAPASVTITAPAANAVLTDTNKPTFSWTFSSPLGLQEERWQVLVFVAGQNDPTAAAGDAVLNSSETFSPATSWTAPKGLSNGTYFAYVRAADVGSSGRYSSWRSVQFTVNTQPSAIPVVSVDATPIDFPQATSVPSVAVSVMTAENGLDSQSANFETNLGSWGVGLNCTLARVVDATVARQGSAYMKATAAAAGQMSTYLAYLPVTPGRYVTAAAWVRPNSTARSAWIAIDFVDSNNVGISSFSGPFYTEQSGRWTQIEVTGAAPTNAAKCEIRIQFEGCATSEQHFIDTPYVRVTPNKSAYTNIDDPNFIWPANLFGIPAFQDGLTPASSASPWDIYNDTGIVIDATGGASGDNVGTLTWNHTISSTLTNQVLIIAVGDSGSGSGTGLATAATFNGVSMTQLAQDQSTSGTNRSITYFQLVNPPSGTHTVSVTLNNGGSNSCAGVSLSLGGVNQSSPFRAAGSAHSNSATSVTATAADTSSDLIVSAVCSRNNSPTPGSSQTLQGSVQHDSTFTYVAIATSRPGNTGSDTASWSIASADNLASLAVAVVPAIVDVEPLFWHSGDSAIPAVSAPTPILMLDLAGLPSAAGAYGLLKMRGAYTGYCLRAYRLADGTTRDIGFTASGDFDLSALNTYAAGSKVYLQVLYDQSGAALDLTEASTSHMFLLHDGTSALTVTAGTITRPCFYAEDAVRGMVSAAFGSTYTGTKMSAIAVGVMTASGSGTTGKTSNLVDDFTTANTSQWTGYGSGVTIASGQLSIVPTTSYPGVTSTAKYSLIGDSCVLELVQRANQGSGSIETQFALTPSTGNQLAFIVSGTNLTMREKVSNVNSDTTVTYNSTSHKYLRFTESSGTITWDTSPDGTTWTTRRTKTAAITGLSSVNVQIQAGYWGTESSVGTALFDALNTGSGTLTMPRIASAYGAGANDNNSAQGGVLISRDGNNAAMKVARNGTTQTTEALTYGALEFWDGVIDDGTRYESGVDGVSAAAGSPATIGAFAATHFAVGHTGATYQSVAGMKACAVVFYETALSTSQLQILQTSASSYFGTAPVPVSGGTGGGGGGGTGGGGGGSTAYDSRFRQVATLDMTTNPLSQLTLYNFGKATSYLANSWMSRNVTWNQAGKYLDFKAWKNGSYREGGAGFWNLPAAIGKSMAWEIDIATDDVPWASPVVLTWYNGSGVWPVDGEMDLQEIFNGGSKLSTVQSFMHKDSSAGSSRALHFPTSASHSSSADIARGNYGINATQIHTWRIEWIAGVSIYVYCDGVLKGYTTDTSYVPNTLPHRFTIQQEFYNYSDSSVAAGAVAHTRVYGMRAYAFTG